LRKAAPEEVRFKMTIKDKKERCRNNVVRMQKAKVIALLGKYYQIFLTFSRDFKLKDLHNKYFNNKN